MFSPYDGTIDHPIGIERSAAIVGRHVLLDVITIYSEFNTEEMSIKPS